MECGDQLHKREGGKSRGAREMERDGCTDREGRTHTHTHTHTHMCVCVHPCITVVLSAWLLRWRKSESVNLCEPTDARSRCVCVCEAIAVAKVREFC